MFKIVHLFLIITIFFTTTTLSASSYDEDVLAIYAKIMPRFVLMSSHKTKLKNEINICVLSEKVDELDSLALINKTEANYPDGIKNYKIKFLQTNYSEINICKNSHLMFLFNTYDEQTIKVVNFSKENKILTVSYDEKSLINGVDISLYLGRKIIPYINMQVISKKGIELDNLLLRISKIYSKELE